MACRDVARLCDKLIVSQAVTFADGTLTINIPAGNYTSGEKYCIIVGQEIPVDATIGANVVITIGTGTTEFPLTNRCCAQVTACAIRSRTKYSTKVVTSATGGSFRLLGKPCCAPNNVLRSLTETT